MLTRALLIGILVLCLSIVAWADESDRSVGSCTDVSPQPPPATAQISISWTTGTPIPVATCRGASGIIGEKFYVFGGQPAASSVHHVYDPVTDTWSDTLAAMPSAGSNVKGVVYNDKLYALGSYDPNHASFRVYDPATNSWTSLTAPSYGTVYKYGVGVANDTLFYYYGRRDANQYTTNVDAYCPANDAWTTMSSAPSPGRSYLACASKDGKCYAVGGYDGNVPITACGEYDPVTDTWTPIDNLPQAVMFGDAAFLGGYLFLPGGGGGYGSWPALSTVYHWDSDSGWVSTDPLPFAVGIPHVGAGNFAGENKILVIGGYDGTYMNTTLIGTVTGLGVAEELGRETPEAVSVSCHPSIFTGATTIHYQLTQRDQVSLSVFDLSGRLVQNLASGVREVGSYSSSWDGRDVNGALVPAGVYLYRLDTGSYSFTGKAVLVR